MMKLLVCFKVTPDMDSITEKEWNRVKNETVDVSFAKKILGLYDESALEMALRLADEAKKQDMEVELTAIIVDSDSEDFILKNLFAVKYSKVININCTMDLRFHPDAVSEIISAYVRKNGTFDAILMGQQASVGDNRQTHLLTAEKLNLPCITQVSDMTLTDKCIRVTSQIDLGILSQTVIRPCVYAIGNALHPYLRVATLREKMASSKSKVDVLSLRDLDLVEEQLQRDKKSFVSLYRENKSRNCNYIEGSTPAEKAGILYETYIKEALKL